MTSSEIESVLKNIIRYHPVDERIASSGQPDAEQFRAIAAAGYEMVVNLALPTSDNALPGEGDIVSALGMTHVHIPVRWDAPQVADATLFCGIMQAAQNKKVWVHCAYNMRVSCFLYFYRKHVLGLPDEQASYPMKDIWQPENVWAELVASVEKHFGSQ